MKSRAFWVGVVGGIAATILIGVLAVPALGVFDMSATGKPTMLDWWGNLNWNSSLVWRAPDTTLPTGADPARGLEHYRSSCLPCHGAPRVSRASWAQRMQPLPPELWREHTQSRTDGELFRIVGGGVRMTGMPAFEADHGEDGVWDIIAFVRKLNDLTEPQREQLQQAAEAYRHQHGEDGGGEEDHHHRPGSESRREEPDHRHHRGTEGKP